MDTLQKLLGRMAGTGVYAPKVPGTIAMRNVYRAIYRWENAGMVEYQKFWKDTPGWVWLTNTGLRSHNLTFTPWSPRQGSEFQHRHFINEIRVKLENRYGFLLPWESERMVRKRLSESREGNHAPDAVVAIDGKRLALEVELTNKTAKRTEAIIKNMLTNYDGIWYFVTQKSQNLIYKYSRLHDNLQVYQLADVLPNERIE
jgi:hypothetical protein